MNIKEAKEIIKLEKDYQDAIDNNNRKTIHKLSDQIIVIRNRNKPVIETLGHIERAKGYIQGWNDRIKSREVKELYESGNQVEDILEVPGLLGESGRIAIAKAILRFRNALKAFEKATKE